MTSKQVKNQVRDNVERGFDRLHRIADVVTFPLAPLDGAIHGTARGILNWLTDNHPQQHNYGSEGGGGGGYGGYPAGIDPNRRAFKLKGNEIADNKGDARGFNNFGNRRANGNKNKDDNAVFDLEDNKIKGNGGKAEGFNDFGNDN